VSKGVRPKRRDRAEQYGPAVVLVFCLVIAGGLGVYPIWHYVENRWPGVRVQQAQVRPCPDRPTVRLVCATIQDGSVVEIEWSGHILNPRTGSPLEVYEKDGHWHARRGVGLPWWAPIPLLIFGAGAIACAVRLLRRLIAVFRRTRHPRLHG